MSYLSAPGVALVATECAVCARPLLDAVSVESGIGPTCRKYMAGEQSPADWAAFAGFIPAALREALASRLGDARSCANLLTHRVASGALSASEALPMLVALGFHRLSAAVAKGSVGSVIIAVEGDRLVVKAPYADGFGRALRAAAYGSRWEPTSKRWSVPIAAKPGLWRALRETYPGALLSGPQGLSTIPA